jgi:hypothetical protein
VLIIEDPNRFSNSRSVGSYLACGRSSRSRARAPRNGDIEGWQQSVKKTAGAGRAVHAQLAGTGQHAQTMGSGVGFAGRQERQEESGDRGGPQAGGAAAQAMVHGPGLRAVIRVGSGGIKAKTLIKDGMEKIELKPSWADCENSTGLLVEAAL